MNEETDQLTTNIEADPPGYRPSKRKKKAKKSSSSGKAIRPDKAKPAKKKGSTKKASTAGKPGKSPKAGAKTQRGKKLPKPAGSGKTSPKPSRTTKTSKESKKVGKSTAGKTGSAASRKSATTPAPVTGNGAKRPYTKRLPKDVDIAALKPAKDYGISRIEQETKKNFGYYVRVGPPGGRSSVFFSDKKHGSPAKALKAAVEKRNELFEALPDWYKVRASRKRGVKVGPAKKKAA